MESHQWSYSDIKTLHDELVGTIRVDGDDRAQAQIKIAICGGSEMTAFCLDVQREDGYKVWAHIEMKSPHLYEVSRHGQRVGYAASTVSPTQEMTQSDARVVLLNMLLDPASFLYSDEAEME